MGECKGYLATLVDMHYVHLNALEGREGDVKIPPIYAVLISGKNMNYKFDFVELLIKKGANVNSLC